MIWLVGCNGMLGKELSIELKKENVPYIETDREVDITDINALILFSKGKKIDYIINCAAYTAVDKAEDEIELCRKINTLGAANIAACANQLGATLIHISTDYVFNGNGNNPYKEEDPTDPIGIYGLTKRDGELEVFKNNPTAYIIRTAWLYGKHGNNFVHTMLNLMQNKSEIKVVDDQYGSPTWAHDLANTILAIINKDIPFGIYHYTNEGETTWYNFAKEIYCFGKSMGLIKKECKITPCTSEEFPAKVKRPKYSVLDKTKIKNVLNINIPTWDKSLQDYFT